MEGPDAWWNRLQGDGCHGEWIRSVLGIEGSWAHLRQSDYYWGKIWSIMTSSETILKLYYQYAAQIRAVLVGSWGEGGIYPGLMEEKNSLSCHFITWLYDLWFKWAFSSLSLSLFDSSLAWSSVGECMWVCIHLLISIVDFRCSRWCGQHLRPPLRPFYF